MPSESSEVPVVSETVPVPLAGASKVGVEPEAPDALELDEEVDEEELEAPLDDDEVEPVEPPF